MITAIQSGLWTDVPPHITPPIINKVLTLHQCTACRLGQMNRNDHRKGTGLHPSTPGQVLSVDYQGKINPPSTRGYTGFWLFLDLHSGYIHAHFTKDKTASTYKDALDNVIHFYHSHQHRVQTIRCDAGSTENDTTIKQYLAHTHQIHIAPAAVDHQEQNPVERTVQTLIKGVSTIMADQQALGPAWWDYAVEYWIATANCRPRQTELMDTPTTPIELVTRIPPSISTRFRFPFGCPVTAVNPDGRHPKYGPIAEFGIAVGPSNTSNGATKLLIPRRGIKPFERLDVLPHIIPPLSDTPPPSLTNPQPFITPDIINFNPLTPPNLDLMEQTSPPGTLGYNLFNIPNHTTTTTPYHQPTSLNTTSPLHHSPHPPNALTLLPPHSTHIPPIPSALHHLPTLPTLSPPHLHPSSSTPHPHQHIQTTPLPPPPPQTPPLTPNQNPPFPST